MARAGLIATMWIFMEDPVALRVTVTATAAAILPTTGGPTVPAALTVRALILPPTGATTTTAAVDTTCTKGITFAEEESTTRSPVRPPLSSAGVLARRSTPPPSWPLTGGLTMAESATARMPASAWRTSVMTTSL